VEGGEKGAAEEKPPISFEDFKKNKEEAEKAAKEAREAEEKAHKAAEDEARHRARAKEDVVKVDDEDDLGGVVRGYKKRADGSTTSYFTREVDPATKALLDAQKAPKRIDPASAGLPAAPAPGATSSGSAWNKAGTWEEKDCSGWATDTLKAGLKAVTATSQADASSMGAMLERMKESSLGAEAEGGRGLLDLASELSSEIAIATARVTEVKSVEGSATVRSSRGNTKHTYEYSFELDFEVSLEQVEPKDGGDAPKKPPKVKGTLKYSDVTSGAQGPSVDVSSKLKKAPTAEYAKRVNAAVDELKAQVLAYLQTFDSQFKQKAI